MYNFIFKLQYILLMAANFINQIEVSKNHTGKDVIISSSAVNHINKVQVPINISEKSNNTNVEVASNGSYTAAEKGKKTTCLEIKEL